MTGLSPHVIKSQKSVERMNEKYDPLFKDANIVNGGFTTYDDHSSDEDAPTQRPVLESSHAPQIFDGHQLVSTETSALNNPAPIYKKQFGNARRPKEADVELGLKLTGYASQQNGAVNSSANAAGAQSTAKAKAFEIMHNWTQEQQENELVSYINVVERKASSANKIMNSVRGHVGWLHSEELVQSLNKFEQLFTTYLGPGIHDRRVTQTTTSLLSRVKLIAEKKTVGGKYLTTGPVRYDGISSLGSDSDRPCIFFSFPYFAVGDFRLKRDQKQTSKDERSTKHSSNHPVRMLLQSRYRLESTQRRDDAQSITTMLTSEVQDCIQPDIKVTVKSNKWKQKIHVPQLWGLSVSGDIMVTSTPLSEKELRGSLLALKATSVDGTPTQSRPAIIRINLEYDGKKEPFVYPVDQCNWYFGLLNKERRILDTLGKDKPGMFRYKLYSKEQQGNVEPTDLVTSDNWLEILHSDTNTDQLDLWMERESLAIEITPDSDDESVKFRRSKANSGAVPSTGQEPKDPQSVGRPLAQTTSSTLLMVPTHVRNFSGSSANSSTISHITTRELTKFTPFLQWPFEDSANKSGGRKHVGRLRLWLDTILVRVASSRFNDMDTELQSLCSPIMAGSFQQSKMSPATIAPPISRSSFADALKRLRAAAPKTPATKNDHGVGASQQATLQKLRDLVENIRSNTNTADLSEADWSQAFKAVQEYYSLPQQDNVAQAVMETLFLHMQITSVDLQGMTRDEVESHFPSSVGQQRVGPRSTRELEAAFAKGKHLLALFAPEKVLSTAPDDDDWETSGHPLVQLYWGLQDRLIKGIVDQLLHATDLTKLLKALSDMIGLAELLHKGVRKRKTAPIDSNASGDEYENIESLVIQAPIPDALEHAIHFLFEVVKYMTSRSAGDPPGNFSLAVGRHLQDAEDALRLAQRYLIEEADQSALDAGLGPVVTPEAIIILLLERLSRGVYRDGTINVLEIYEKIVEKLASQVELSASRHLLLELNRVSEEIQTILDVLNQQKRFFELYSRLLDPASFERPTAKRRTRFPYEKFSIDRNIRASTERISDCRDLLKRATRLAVQNVQLVESYQDDNNKTLMIFTFVTITFLPLSFVTGFFGMNVEGISGTTTTVKHFWIIAIPVTVGVGIFSLILTYWGRIKRNWNELSKWLDNRKGHGE